MRHVDVASRMADYGKLTTAEITIVVGHFVVNLIIGLIRHGVKYDDLIDPLLVMLKEILNEIFYEAEQAGHEGVWSTLKHLLFGE